MRKGQVFIGNVNVCTEYETKDLIKNNHGGNISGFRSSDWDSKIFMESLPLLKLKDGSYVCIKSLDSLNSYIDLYKHILGICKYVPEIILFNKPNKKSDLYVDEKSLKSYYDDNVKDQKITIRSVQNDLMMDPRLSSGVEVDTNTGIITVTEPCKIKRHQ